MSRSIKKPIIKDKNQYSQKLGNRKMRTKTKILLKMRGEDAALPIDKSELVNDYDVSDYKFINKDKKSTRK